MVLCLSLPGIAVSGRIRGTAGRQFPSSADCGRCAGL